MGQALLEINDLAVSFSTQGGEVQAVRGVTFAVDKGETVAIVGESGCGKSVTAQSIMRLIPQPPGRIKNGTIHMNGKDLASLSEKQMRGVRGKQIGMIFQDPMTSLNPTLKVGDQLTEGILTHQKISKADAKKEAIDLLHLVGIANPEERLQQYPHQFSGGMRQRLMIAMALMCKPELLIADEPTTALDVTIQAQIIDLFKEIQRKTGVAIIIITHDLGVVAQIADRINVMYAGEIVETGTVKEIFYDPQHPYTRGLLHSVPRLDGDRSQKLVPIVGSPPDLFSPPEGCAFARRCDYAMEVCVSLDPDYTKLSNKHYTKCWLQDTRAEKPF
ncbi:MULTISPECIES: ABC transporter ATP-binding protein [Alteribacter]|uniref:ABC transporter ATP-binding protein n=1 Tax=Alteribacter keqinensis TaxID=2483800 RepID=A0A3M7TX45_9BACI|nr:MULTISPECIES: ABC transporter ATP-binding protein [Alteribacter]MBM7096034.1 ABC transporter ATP-binding protein [Alteribacter salitolerans]RNA69849.1 ABC transporter ATP-binding protein [Alteribacter keqinensis]